MRSVQYFAYGSIMLTRRLRQRCSSATYKNVASAPDYRFSFSKRSIDESGKGNVIPAQGDRVFGVLFDLDKRELPCLDEFEGVGNGYYREDAFEIELMSGERISAVTYVADSTYIDHSLKPYDWYLALVLAGAREHRLPIPYVSQLEAVQAVLDPNPNRRARLEALALLEESST